MLVGGDFFFLRQNFNVDTIQPRVGVLFFIFRKRIVAPGHRPGDHGERFGGRMLPPSGEMRSVIFDAESRPRVCNEDDF